MRYKFLILGLIVISNIMGVIGQDASIVSDTFSSTTLNSAWRFYDPYSGTGDVNTEISKLTLTGSNAEISIPTHGNHNLTGAENNAPRLLQSADDADFTIEAKFESAPYEGQQMQGLIVQETNDTFLAWGTFAASESLYGSVIYVNGGITTNLVNVSIPSNSLANYLRLSRVGDDWEFFYSDDGSSWISAGSATRTLAVTEVGTYAGSGSPYPGFTSRVDYFQTSSSPVSDTDSYVGLNAATIDVWYGDNQSIGVPGLPQTWFNLLGNVTKPAGVTTVSYTLNGGHPKFTDLGRNTNRLVLAGDMNIQIAIDDLVAGDNEIVLYEPDPYFPTSTRTVTLNYTPGLLPTLNRTIDFSLSATPDADVQIVDGKWRVDPDGIRVVERGYDRLLNFGSFNWESNYEVTAEFTVHEIGAGIGIAVGWQGHTRRSFDEEFEAYSGWPLQGLGWIRRVGSSLSAQLLAVGYSTDSVERPDLDGTGKFKIRFRTELVSDSNSLMSLKIWPDSVAEPADWDIQTTGANRPGSVLLVSHGIDSTWHNVTVTPLSADNNAPQFTSEPIILARVGQPYTYNVTAGDIDGDVVSITANTIPSWLNFVDNGDGTATLSGTPTVTDIGDTVVELEVSDGLAMDLQSYTLTTRDYYTDSGLVSDDFGPETSLGSVWTYSDPTGGVTMTPSGANILMELAEGTNYNMWYNANRAPRLLQDANDADFDIRAKFDNLPDLRYQFHGLLVEEDSDTFLMAYIISDGTYLNYNVSYIDAGTVDRIYGARLSGIEPQYVRLIRNGVDYTAQYSENGLTWFTATTFTNAIQSNQVGLFAANNNPYPAFTSCMDAFIVSTDMITDSDSGECGTNAAPQFTSTADTQVMEGVSYTYNIVATDAEGDSLTITANTIPAWLTLTDNGDGTATLTGKPTASDVGDHAIELMVSDASASATQAYILTVVEYDEPPIAIDDSATTDEDTVVVIDVLSNDSDPTDQTLSVASVDNPSLEGGTVINNGNGTVTYTPALDFSGVDTFDYMLTDGFSSVSATVTVTINEINDAPTFTSTTVTTVTENDVYTYNITTDDAEGDALTITGVTVPVWLTLTDNGDGTATLTGTPTTTDIGDHAVELSVSDSLLNNSQSFTITVFEEPLNAGIVSDDFGPETGLNTAIWRYYDPQVGTGGETELVMTGSNAVFRVPEGFSHDMYSGRSLAARILQSAEDADFDVIAKFDSTPTLRYQLQGIIAQYDDDTFIRFDFYHNGSQLRIFSAEIDGNTNLGTYANTGVSGTPNYLRMKRTGSSYELFYSDNGTDWTSITTFTSSMVVTEIGLYGANHTPNPAFDACVDYFYSASDPITDTDTANCSLANTAPEFTSTPTDIITTDATYTYNIATTDAQDDTLTITAPTLPTWLTLTDNGDGTATLTGTPTNTEIGDHSVELNVSDGDLSATQSFTLTVISGNEAPVANADSATTDEDNAVVISVLTNDTDADGDTLNIASFDTTSVNGGSISDNGDGTLTYTPALNFSGSDSFDYTVSDGVITDSASVTITVNSVNDVPVFTSTVVTTATENEPYTYNISANDVDGDTLTITAPTLPSWLTLTDNGNGTATLTGTPDLSHVGDHAVQIRIADSVDNVTQSFVISVFEQVLTAGLVSDDFSPETGLNTSIWRYYDPQAGTAGETELIMTGSNALFRVPEGYSHDMYTGRSLAPRILQDVNDADFDVITKFDALPALRYQIQGIIVQNDNDTFIRFDAYHNGSEIRIFAAEIDGNTRIGTYANTGVSGTPNHLRMKRTGNNYELLYSVDGSNWVSLTTFTSSMTVTEVGIFAANHTPNPAFDVCVDYFYSADDPITDTDTADCSPVNIAPEFTSVGVTNVGSGSLYLYDIFTTDINGDDVLTITAPTLPTWLTFTDNGDGTATLSGNPTDTHIGDHAVELQVSDGDLSATQSFTITVYNVNDAPVANADSATTDEDTAVLIDLLTNDTDADGDTLSISDVDATSVEGGTITDNGDGTVNYEPAPDFNGTDTFIYTLTDSIVNVTGTVTVTVNAVNDQPVISSTAPTTVTEDELYTYTFTASDVDGDGLALTAPTLPAWLTFTDNGDNTATLTGTPTASDAGDHLVELQASDGFLGATQSFTITVTALPTEAGVVSDDFNPESNLNTSIWRYYDPQAGTAGETDLFLTGSNVLFSIPEGYSHDMYTGRSLAPRILQSAEDADFDVIMKLDQMPSLRYQFAGLIVQNDNDTFIRFDVLHNGSQLRLFSAEIDGNTNVGTYANLAASVTPYYLRMKRTDNNYELFYSANGTDWTTASTFTSSMVVTEIGLFGANHTPNPAYDACVDYFYSASDPITDTDPARCALNMAPEFTSVGVTSASSENLYLYDVFTNDLDGDPVTITGVTIPAWLTFNDNGDGTATLSGTPAESDVGDHAVELSVSDGALSTIQSFTISVVSSNEAPVANTDTVTTDEDTAVVIDMLTNDTDADGDTLSISDVDTTSTNGGGIVNNGDGTATYTPALDFVGADSFTYTLTDGILSVTGTVEITVNAVNDQPIITSTAVTDVVELDTYTYTLTATDVDGDGLTITASTLPAWLTLTDNGDGTATLTGIPTATEVGDHAVELQVSDGFLGDTQSFTITVTERPANAGLVSDDFSPETGLNTGIWRYYDPLAGQAGESNLIMNGTNLILSVTSGTSHDMYAKRSFAPRILQSAENGDFDISVKFESVPSLRYQFHGLLIQNDNDTFIRYDRLSLGGVERLYAAEIDGDILVSTYLTQDINPSVSYLRMIRTGNDYELLYSMDGSNWTSVKTFTSSMVVTEVGIFAANHTPHPAFDSCVDYFYSANDPITDTDATNCTTTVIVPNQAPVANDDTTTTDEDVAVIIDVVANDTDYEGTTLSVSAVDATSANGGTVTDNGDGTVTYTPPANYFGEDSFGYTVSDGDLTDSATVTVTVNAVNDAPIVNAVSATINSNTATIIDVTANDSDIEGSTLTITAVDATSANGGTITNNGDGTVTYTPPANFVGEDSFSYTVSDGELSATATVTVTINNQAPVANADISGTIVNTAVIINVIANDSDPEGTALTITAVDATSTNGGTVTNNGDGTVTFTPALDFIGDDSFGYTISDGDLTASTTVTVTVSEVNNQPIANAVSATTNSNTVVTINVIANDSDPDGDTISVSAVDATSANGGSITNNGDGTVTFTPALNYVGSDSFGYTISDGELSATATVTVTINNQAPVANADSSSTNSNTAVTINMIANDSDPEGATVSVVGVDATSANGGSVTNNGDGTVTFTPALNYVGSDSFGYTISDGSLTASATVTVNVNNQAPVANADSSSTNSNTAVAINVIANDSDPEGATVSVVGVDATSANGGSITNNGDGTVTFTPALNYVGSDSFGYTISDGGVTASATVTVTVNNQAPVANADSATTESTVAVLVNVISNDSDPEGATVSVVGVDATSANGGTVTNNGDGTVTYTSSSYVGSDSFNYTISDGSLTAVGTVTVNVTAFNQPPIANADTITTDVNVAVMIFVVANDSDPEGNSLTVTGVDATSVNGGSVVNNNNGTVTYTPPNNFTGSDSFNYTVSDGVKSSTGSVTVSINAVNQPPVANTDTATTSVNAAVGINILANDSDPEGANLMVVMVDPMSQQGGTILNNGDGTVTYTPSNGFMGDDSFSYTINDGELSATGTVTVTVSP